MQQGNRKCGKYWVCTLLLHNTSVQTKIGWHAYTTHENIFDMWWLLWNGTHSTHLWWREKYCKKVLVSPVRGPGDTESLTTAPTWDNHQNKFSEVSSEAYREFSFQFDFQMYMRVCMYMYMHVKACVGIMGRLMLLWAWSRQRSGFLPFTLMWIPETELCEASAISYKPFSSHNRVLWDRELSSIWNLPVRLGQLASKSHLPLFSALGF